MYREQNRTFQDIGLYSTGINAGGYMVTITGSGDPQRLPAVRLTDGVLPLLRITPVLGRSFTRADDSPGSPATAILSDGYWRETFGGDRTVIGRAITVDQVPRTIIGVLPPHVRFIDGTSPAVFLLMQPNRGSIYLGNLLIRSHCAAQAGRHARAGQR